MPPLIKIESIAGDRPVEILQVSEGVLTIGREPENEIVVDSEVVSRRHGELVAAGAYWIFRDLGSSNGSWINNKQIDSGRHYLLRNGDAIQLADCPLRISELNAQSGARDDRACVLVFYGDTFSGAFPLSAESPRFAVGGAGAQLILEGDSDKYGEIVNHRNTNRLEFSVFKPGAVTLNGRAIESVVGLVDRDEIEIGDIHLVIADGRSAVHRDSTKFQFDPNYKVGDLRGTSAFAGPSHQSSPDMGWESVRKRPENRSALFGQTAEQFDVSATSTAIPSQRLRTHSGYETHPAQRFSSTGPVIEDDESGNEKILILLGAFLLVVVVGLLVFFFALKG